MSTKTKQKKQERLRRTRLWIRIRYLLPIFVSALTLATLFIPCFRYTTAATGTNDVVSCAELIANAWEGGNGSPSVREVLFGGGGYAKATVSFSWAVLITILAGVVLYAVGVGMAVWSAVGAFRYFRMPHAEDNSRILYMTVFPNRVLTLIYEALILPLLLFPRLLAWYYDSIMHYAVLLNLTFAEPLVIGGILYIGTVVAAVLTRPTERRLGMDPFARRSVSVQEKETEVPAADEQTYATEAERRYEELNRKTREEQAERIARLLRHDDTEGE
ncbi:MAG: hypothetical protein E7668_04620 [Ruminococcaceae bacterium]|nr:hypothetical protein [Oscillospiraceae bacterium]